MFYKYPRTPHLPWSPGKSRDDHVLNDTNHFEGKELIASIKLDGENTSIYSNHIHARSINSKDHNSRHWVKSFSSNIKHLIPDGWRICGENLYAKHSIYYEDLHSYFIGFSIWDEKNVCLDWNTTIEFFKEIGIIPVTVFSTGDVNEIDKKFDELFKNKHEGYVIRLADEFKYEDFEKSIAKYVRPNHVQTNKHWMYEEVIPNQLWKHI